MYRLTTFGNKQDLDVSSEGPSWLRLELVEGVVEKDLWFYTSEYTPGIVTTLWHFSMWGGPMLNL